METDLDFVPPAGYHLHGEEKPMRCSNCFGQEACRHVEFPAAFDGPVVNQFAVVTEPGVDAIAIDDLVLCERCLKLAAKILGFVHAPELVDELRATRDKLTTTEAQLADSNRALADMHQAHRSLVQRRQRNDYRKPENVPDPGTPTPQEPVPA